MNLEFELTPESTYVIDGYDTVLLTIPTYILTDFVEGSELNANGEVTQEYFEERNDSGKGFNYIPIDIVETENSYKYLQENAEDTIIMYLKDVVKQHELERKKNKNLKRR